MLPDTEQFFKNYKTPRNLITKIKYSRQKVFLEKLDLL